MKNQNYSRAYAERELVGVKNVDIMNVLVLDKETTRGHRKHSPI